MNTTNTACPKCGSIQLHSDKKGYSLKKGAIGWFVTGGVGLLGGLIGSNKIVITCLSCGHSFKPGEGRVLEGQTQYNNTEVQNQYSTEGINKEVETIKENQKPKELSQSIKNKNIKRKKVICSECNSINELHFKFCRVCGVKIDVSKMEMVNNGQNFEYMKCPKCYQRTPMPSKKCKYCSICGEELKND